MLAGYVTSLAIRPPTATAVAHNLISPSPQGTNAHVLLLSLPDSPVGVSREAPDPFSAAARAVARNFFLRESLWVAHLESPLLRSFHPPGSTQWGAAVEAALAAAEEEAEELQHPLQQLRPDYFGHMALPVVVFECPLGLPVLAPLAGLCLCSEGSSLGSGTEPPEMYLVPPSLLIVIAAAACRAVAPMTASQVHASSADATAVSECSSLVLLSNGLLLPQDPDSSAEDYLSSSLICVLSPADGSIRLFKSLAVGGGFENSCYGGGELQHSDGDGGWSDAEGEGVEEEEGPVAQLLLRADLVGIVPLGSSAATINPTLPMPKAWSPGRALVRGLVRAAAFSAQAATLGSQLQGGHAFAMVCHPGGEIEEDVAGVTMAEAALQVQEGTAGGLLSGFDSWVVRREQQ